MLSLKRKTQGIRAYTANTCLRLLTPNYYILAKECLDGLSNAQLPRPSTKVIHRLFGETPLIGAEIGTGFGINALNLLNELSIERLYCIDPFIPYVDGEIKNQTSYLSNRESTLKILSKHHNVTIIGKTSTDALREIPDKLDFVYVDGDHSYSSVVSDMQNYYPLVRRGGLIAGHDIGWLSVKRGVENFCRVNRLSSLMMPPDWIILK